eukprot:554012-Pleurochrysis_carterae.AAC.1
MQVRRASPSQLLLRFVADVARCGLRSFPRRRCRSVSSCRGEGALTSSSVVSSNSLVSVVSSCDGAAGGAAHGTGGVAGGTGGVGLVSPGTEVR